MNTKTTLTALAIITWASAQTNAQLISEFEPNPAGGDPASVSLELFGTPGSTFNGFYGSIEIDGGSSIGVLDRAGSIGGTFDANGLLVVSIGDLENPSFTFFINDTDLSGSLGTDLDAGDDGLDNLGAFGTVFDAVSILDSDSENRGYAAALGGVDLADSGDQPRLAFRSGSNGDWFLVNDPDNGEVYDSIGTSINPNTFSFDPTAGTDTFGTLNAVVPEPGTYALLAGLCGLTLVALKRRRA